MTSLASVRPGKVVAVHLSYASRAAERGRTPEFPSYFLKPSTSVRVGGGQILRPHGCELLAFEGEIALVIGTRAYRVDESEGWSCVSGVTAANDFGVYDLRYADSGSNLRSKGADGFTPLGPEIIDAASVDPRDLHLRTWVNGELAQDAHTGSELLFTFGRLVADLSRLMTLEPGDVVLTGTPTGSTVVVPGDTVEVEVWADTELGHLSTGRLTSTVAQDHTPLASIGALPHPDDDARTAAYGAGSDGSLDAATDVADDPVLATLSQVSTATISSQLRKRGLSGCSLDGLIPTRPDLRMIGRARTVEYLPLREDLFAQRGGGYNAQKRAADSIGPGEILVIGARGEKEAGTIGDILALRVRLRGGAGIVTDGSIRDFAAMTDLDIPCYTAGAHPAVLGRRHVPWATDVAVDCGGTLVQPGDLLVGDSDGVVLVPDAVAEDLARDAVEQEREERFILERVGAGDSVQGLYPVSEGRRSEYEAWCSEMERS